MVWCESTTVWCDGLVRRFEGPAYSTFVLSDLRTGPSHRRTGPRTVAPSHRRTEWSL